jgi:hypothetical protein
MTGSTRRRGGALAALPVRRLGIPLLLLVVTGALIARARLGLDLGDGTHATPALLYLMAASSALAAIARGSVPWSVRGGVAAVLGAMSHPVTAPAGAALLIVSLVRGRGRVRAGLAAGAGDPGRAAPERGMTRTLWSRTHAWTRRPDRA